MSGVGKDRGEVDSVVVEMTVGDALEKEGLMLSLRLKESSQSQVKSNALKMAEENFPGWTAQKKVDTLLRPSGEWILEARR